MRESTRALLGRAAELQALLDAGRDAESGRGSVWMVVGEPGIGKSRLVEEVATRLEDRETLVAWGRAWESGGAPPYWPWVQVLRCIVRRRGAGAFGAHRAALLQPLLPELGGDPGGEVAQRLPPDEARFRLLDAIVGALLDVAEGGPLCVVLEDLHVADPSTLLVLELLAAQARTCPLLVLGTHREVKVSGAEGSAELLRLARTCRRIPLQRLTRDHVHAFVGGIVAGEPSVDVVDVVYASSEGNPLFLVELGRWFADRHEVPSHPGALALPGTVRALIEQRLQTVPPPARPLLEMAAVLGRNAPIAVLARVAGLDRVSIEASLDDLAVANVIERQSPHEIRFSHVLVREVLYAGIDDGRREELHVRSADACLAASPGPEPPWSELAHHLLLGGEPHRERAIEAAACAGEQAMLQFAFDDAVGWFRRALEHLDTHGPSAAARRAELLLTLSRAELLAGDVEGSRARCLDVATIARDRNDARLLARAALEYGSLLVFGKVSSALIELLEEAVGALGDSEPGLRARVLSRLAAAQQPALDPTGPFELARRAVALARTVGDPSVLLDVMRSAGSALADLAPPPERLALDREHQALARQQGDTAGLLTASQRVFFDALELGNLLEAGGALVTYEDAAQQAGVPQSLWRAAALRATLLAFEGRFAEAEDAWQRAQRISAQARDPNAPSALFLHRVLRLLSEQRTAEALEAMVAPMLPAGPDDSEVLEALVAVFSSAIRARTGERGGPGAPAFIVGMMTSMGDPSLLWLVTECAIGAEDSELAAQALTRHHEVADRFTNWGMVGLFVGEPNVLGRARLQRMLGQIDEAQASFVQAREMAVKSRARAAAAWTLVEHARMLLELGNDGPAGRGTARQMLQTALEEAAALGWTHGQRAIAAELERCAPDPSTGPRQPAAAADPGPGGPSSAAPVDASLQLRPLGDAWEISCPHGVIHMRDTKGLRMLSMLVAEPGRAFHVLDLVGSTPELGDAGETIDVQARDAYRARVRDLREELEEAEAWNDPARAERLQAELEAIEAELRRSIGLGGRPRREKAAAQRARVNVQRRLKDVVRRIGAELPPLGRDLEVALRTGITCVYAPP